MINFVNNGTDEAILKSMPTENCSDDLVKAMNKAGLVQKQITVHGKNGDYQTMKWVRASEVEFQAAGKTKPESTSKSAKDAVSKKYKKTSVAITDKWGDKTGEVHSGFVNSNGDMYDVEDKGNGRFVIQAGDDKRGHVATINGTGGKGFTEDEAWNKVYELLSGTKFTSEQKPSSVKASVGDVIAVRSGSETVSMKVTAVNPDSTYEVVRYDLSGKNTKSTVKASDIVKVVTSAKKADSTQKKDHSKDSFTDFLDWTKTDTRAAYLLDRVEEASGDSKGMSEGENREYWAEALKKYCGYDMTSKPKKDTKSKSTSPFQPVEHKGVKIKYDSKTGTWSTYDSHGELEDTGFKTVEDAKADIDDKAKYQKPKTQKLSKADAKAKTQSFTSKVGKTEAERSAFMDKVKAAGITWKENDKPGINWMRCCMAMNSHFENGGTFSDAEAPATPASSAKTEPYKVLPTATPEAIKSLYARTKNTHRLNATFIFDKSKEQLKKYGKLQGSGLTVLSKAVYQVADDNAFQSMMDKYDSGFERDAVYNYIGFYIKNDGFGTSSKTDKILESLSKKYKISVDDVYKKCDALYKEYMNINEKNLVSIADNEFPQISNDLVTPSARKNMMNWS
jgi:hypothetical protein